LHILLVRAAAGVLEHCRFEFTDTLAARNSPVVGDDRMLVLFEFTVALAASNSPVVGDDCMLALFSSTNICTQSCFKTVLHMSIQVICSQTTSSLNNSGVCLTSLKDYLRKHILICLAASTDHIALYLFKWKFEAQ
jgi:hypothetical protein